MRQVIFTMTVVFCFLCFEAPASDAYRLQRLSCPIQLDGLSTEAAWQDIAPLPLTMFTPTFQGELTERTEIRIAYDDHYIYAAGRLYDSDKNGVQAYSLVRDLDRGGDFFNILLDTFNDNENLLAFVTTPAGNRLDAEIINDGEGADFFNQDWNGFWECAVVQNDQGWFAEMRIPFSSLRFQDIDGKVVFGLIVHRRIGRKNERQTFPPIPPKWTTAPWKASQARDVMLEGVYRRRPLYLSPYVLGGMRQFRANATGGNRSALTNDSTREIGLDLEYGLSNNLSLNVTLNTDFAQVEADNQQVNLTRFSLFFPEKRQFFQERSGIFSFKTGEQSRLFHSRRIGLTEDGESVRILGGSRLVGRIGLWDIGMLDMQTARSSANPAENFGVLRLRRRVFNEKSFVGSMATSRIGENGTYNFTYALDGNFHLFDNDYFIFKVAHSLEKLTGNASRKGLPDGSFLSFFYERRNEKGFGFLAEFRRSGQRFNPGVGFTLRRDFLLSRSEVRFGRFLNQRSIFRRHTISLASAVYMRNSNRSVESALHKMTWNSEFKSGDSIEINLRWRYEDILSPFALSRSVEVPSGSFHFLIGEAALTMFDGNRLRTNASIQAGSFYDGNEFQFTFSPTWIQSRHLEFSGEFELNRISFPERQLTFNSTVTRFRILAALNKRLSANTLIQHNSLEDNVGINARLRYNFSERHDLYLVYNEILGDDNDLVRFGARSQNKRTFLVKYIRTFMN